VIADPLPILAQFGGFGGRVLQLRRAAGGQALGRQREVLVEVDDVVDGRALRGGRVAR
jgi:hypothetical protein